MGVERRCRLVQQQDRRVLQNGARNRNPLFLPAGEFKAAFPHHGSVALRQFTNEFVDLGKPRRLPYRSIVAADAAIGDVVAHGIVEQHRILRNDADCGAQGRLGHIADILPIDRHAAIADIVKAKQDTRDGRLARTRRPDNGNRLSGRHGE